MSKSKNEKTEDLRNEAKIGGKLPGRNVSEQADIEQARVENRREADLDDKTPAGDGGPEDRGDNENSNKPKNDSNY